MKISVLLPLAFAAVAYGHTIFQKVSVNGVDQGHLKGVRTPGSTDPYQNYPIESVNDPEIACNKRLQFTDNTVIDIPAGARVGAWWGHVIGGPQYPGDTDNPIAPSHWGPTMVYLARVDNAVTAEPHGHKWFKIAEDGLNTTTGKWGVDRMIAAEGWQYFKMPTCVAPGNYLMRVEILALHGAYAPGGAQFYMECAQINVTGRGSSTGTDLVSFPGAYTQDHPGIAINIYDHTGTPNNGLKPYNIPGPPVLKCSAAGGPGSATPAAATPATPKPTQQAKKSALWNQCGGTGWTGSVDCASGSCKAISSWYSQCVPSGSQ